MPEARGRTSGTDISLRSSGRGQEGFAYHPMEVLRSGPVLEMINRLAVLKVKCSQFAEHEKTKVAPDARQTAVALLGAAKDPALTLSKLVETYGDLIRLER